MNLKKVDINRNVFVFDRNKVMKLARIINYYKNKVVVEYYHNYKIETVNINTIEFADKN